MNQAQVKGRVKRVKGKIKKGTGSIDGNKTLGRKARAQETVGNVQAGFEDLKSDLKIGS